MAHWISSKLKAAESLLQQIDQQAAESLGKNEKPVSDVLFGLEESPRSIGAKPSIKEQLKKKAPFMAKHDDMQVLARSSNDIMGNGEAQVLSKMNSNSNLIGDLMENDWTKLLSTPNRRGVHSGQGRSRTGSRVSGTQTPRKDGKVGNYSVVPSLSPVGGKTEKVESNGVEGSKKSVIGLENNGAGSVADVKSNKDDDPLPRAASVLFPEYDAGSGSVSNTSTTEDTNNAKNMGFIKDASEKVGEANRNMDNSELYPGIAMVLRNSFSTDTVSASPMDGESNSDTDSSLSSDSEVERERRREVRKRRQQVLAARAITKAVETIKSRENLVARLEGEKLSLEKMLEGQTRQQVKEASDLQTVMMENMEAAELEKQKHNNTRMEAFPRLAKLEATNADLARSLAIAQKNLEIEGDHITELRQQIYRKETACEELRRKISHSNQNAAKVTASKGVEFDTEMLEAEYSFVSDKIGRLQEQAKILETSIQTIQNELEVPTEVEIEFKGRLSQLTDLLIKKQAQVETLVSKKAMLLLKNEAISKLLHENGSTFDSVDLLSASSRNDLELGALNISNWKLTPLLKERMRTSKQHFGSLVRHLDSIFCAGAVVLKRNWRIRIWGVVYLVLLHIWVLYILSWHSPISPESGAVVSLDNISKSGGGA